MPTDVRRILSPLCLAGVLVALAAHAQPQPAPSVPVVAAAPRAIASRRVVPLEGQSNFRDLGGYETVDGRHVKWGRVYRSGELSRLTDADYRRLSPLGIRTIVDLRDEGERASQPTVWRAGPVRTFLSPKQQSSASVGSRLFSSPDLDAAQARAGLAGFYSRMPRLYAPEYRAMFRQLLEDHTPLLVHCTAGKDRSGLASALILTALGVPRATVVQDYELTDQLLKPALLPAKTAMMKRIQSLSPDARAAIIRADPAYIEAAFQAMRDEYGSVDRYLSVELGVGPEQKARLRKLLLD
jgi:protein-tyrosine phosphatase